MMKNMSDQSLHTKRFWLNLLFLVFTYILSRAYGKSTHANVVVALDGSGDFKTIAEAITKAPRNSATPYVIHIKAGKYVEKKLNVESRKINLWFIGEGKGKTIISGKKSVGPQNMRYIRSGNNKISTSDTATFAASGNGLMLQGITFVNEAGPANNQAVALLVEADKSVIYNCEIKGYQDTLYVKDRRQFYRECDIYGTVDFIFGDASAVFQSCNIWVRKPINQQKNVITAQSRMKPNGVTGISIHGCQIRAAPDLESHKSSIQTYLGRPWRAYSRVVFLESYIGDHIHSKGWLEWDATSPINTLYYGEYKNYGPGADISQRVNWTSLHVNMSTKEARQFTVAQFIQGTSWIEATGVPYQANLFI